jgi:hypothetical protein
MLSGAVGGDISLWVLRYNGFRDFNGLIIKDASILSFSIRG